LVTDFTDRKEEIKKKVLGLYDEISHARADDDMADLIQKARGILKVLENATTVQMLERVESGVLSLRNDLSRATMDFD